MKTVGSYEAKTHLPQLLDRVGKGETITITRHGRPVAILQPVNAERRRDVAAVIRDLREFRDRHTLGGLSLRDLIREGRT